MCQAAPRLLQDLVSPPVYVWSKSHTLKKVIIGYKNWQYAQQRHIDITAYLYWPYWAGMINFYPPYWDIFLMLQNWNIISLMCSVWMNNYVIWFTKIVMLNHTRHCLGLSTCQSWAPQFLRHHYEGSLFDPLFPSLFCPIPWLLRALYDPHSIPPFDRAKPQIRAPCRYRRRHTLREWPEARPTHIKGPSINDICKILGT